jgi:hypothetical protein
MSTRFRTIAGQQFLFFNVHGRAGDSCNVVGHGKGGWLVRLLVSMNNYSKRMEQINGVEFVSWGEVTNCKV